MTMGGRRATMLAAVGIAVLLCPITACAREESGTPEASVSSQTGQSTSSTVAAPTVELLDPGAEPREVLRFSVAEGAQFRATMTTEMGITIEVAGEQAPAPTLPPILADLSATVNKVAANGDIDYTFAFESMRAGEGIVLSPEAQQSFDQISGITGQAVMTANGEQTHVDLDIPSDVQPEMRTSLEGMSSQLGKLTAPFPTEPVGIGGSWRTTASAELNGLRTDVVTTYTLRERNGDQYRTELSYEQSAPDQDANIPGLPPGVRAHVSGMAVSGSGEINGSLSQVFPATSTMQGGGTIDMSINDGQNSEDMHQTIDVKVSLQPTP